MPYHYPFVGLRENADVSGLLLTNVVTTMLLVAVTGLGTLADRKASRDAGFDLHLSKPFDSNLLVAALV